jgi:formate dehydrogenase subunit delta
MYSQVRLANDIAVQFHHQAPDTAAAAIAAHIRAFWDPRMRTELTRLVAAEPDALDPLVLAAVRLLDA